MHSAVFFEPALAQVSILHCMDGSLRYWIVGHVWEKLRCMQSCYGMLLTKAPVTEYMSIQCHSAVAHLALPLILALSSLEPLSSFHERCGPPTIRSSACLEDAHLVKPPGYTCNHGEVYIKPGIHVFHAM